MTSVAGGGKCGPGALSASFSKFATVSGFVGSDPISGTITSAIVGGTASVLGGGKFANGATTAAMGYLFNAWAHRNGELVWVNDCGCNRFGRFIYNALDTLSQPLQAGLNWILSTGAPSLPDALVGDQNDPRAVPNKGGTKWTSGPLTPANGGVGDYQTDLDKLTGGTRPQRPGDSAPPGSQVGTNGIFGRPQNSSGGKSIDIPANGGKPHETLHYP